MKVSVFSFAIFLLANSAGGSEVLTEHKECYNLLSAQEYQLAYDLANESLDGQISKEQRSEAYNIMAWVAFKQNLFAESIGLYELAIKYARNDDNRAKLMKNLGGIFHYINEFDGAINLYRQAAELSEEWAPNNYYNMAISQIALRDYATAAESLDKGIRACNKVNNEYYKARLWNQYGIIERDMYEVSKDPVHARLAGQYFHYALEIKENKVEVGRAHHYLATLALLEGDTISAIDQLAESIALQPNHQYRFHALMTQGNLYKQLNDTGKAVQSADSALALYPHITRAREEIMVFFLAQELGMDVLAWHKAEFEAYLAELEKAQNQCRAYIGKLIMREEKLKQQLLWLGICLALTIIVSLITFYHLKRRVIRARILKIKESGAA